MNAPETIENEMKQETAAQAVDPAQYHEEIAQLAFELRMPGRVSGRRLASGGSRGAASPRLTAALTVERGAEVEILRCTA